MAKKKKRYYAVARGKKRGIFDNWLDCCELTDTISNNLFRSFDDFEDAQWFLLMEAGLWVEEDEINKRI